MTTLLSIGGYQFRYVDPLYRNFDYDMNMLAGIVFVGFVSFMTGLMLGRLYYFIKIRPKDKYDKDPSWDERLAKRWKRSMYSEPDMLTNREYRDGIRAIRSSYDFLNSLSMEIYIRKKHGMTKKEKAERKAERLRRKAEMLERKAKGKL